MNKASLLTFPCDFPIKVIGEANPQFEAAVITIIRQHSPTVSESAFTLKPSKKGNYQSMTIVINATSQEQIDAIYHDLTESKYVMMAL
jgi:hypothetical protein